MKTYHQQTPIDDRVASADRWRDSVYRKVTVRLMPVLALAYMCCMLDRSAMGFAKLEFLGALHLTEATYGLAAGLFYIGYMVSEVPSNIYMHKKGVKKTLLRIMVLWGIVTGVEAFAKTAGQFYLIRFLLGVAEGGFLPGTLLYLTYWYPADKRAQANALFLVINPFAGMVGGVLTGAIMGGTIGWSGLADWQNLFVVLGTMTILLGVFCFFYLTNYPEHARWLSKEERGLIALEVTQNAGGLTRQHEISAGFLKDRRVYIAMAIYFTLISSSSTFAMWGPSLIRSLTIKADIRSIGFTAAIPYAVAIPGTYLLGKSSDYFQERRWHFLACTLMIGVGFAGLSLFGQGLVAGIAFLSFTAAGIYGGSAIFFTLLSSFLSADSAAGGIALITAAGGLGGFTMPWIIGLLRTATGSFSDAILVVAALAVTGGGLLILGVRDTKVGREVR